MDPRNQVKLSEHQAANKEYNGKIFIAILTGIRQKSSKLPDPQRQDQVLEGTGAPHRWSGASAGPGYPLPGTGYNMSINITDTFSFGTGIQSDARTSVVDPDPDSDPKLNLLIITLKKH
jgi:hypothetical protein